MRATTSDNTQRMAEVKRMIVPSDWLSSNGTLDLSTMFNGLLATPAELNRLTDVSTRIVPVLATGSITLAANEGKVNLLDATATLVTLTLPAATGTGGVYRFVVKTINTSSYVIQKAGSDVFRGIIVGLDNDANAVTGYAAIAAGDDVLTLNGTTTGGQVGDYVEFIDIASGVWSVRGMVVVPAGSNVADCFS